MSTQISKSFQKKIDKLKTLKSLPALTLYYNGLMKELGEKYKYVDTHSTDVIKEISKAFNAAATPFAKSLTESILENIIRKKRQDSGLLLYGAKQYQNGIKSLVRYSFVPDSREDVFEQRDIMDLEVFILPHGGYTLEYSVKYGSVKKSFKKEKELIAFLGKKINTIADLLDKKFEKKFRISDMKKVATLSVGESIVI